MHAATRPEVLANIYFEPPNLNSISRATNSVIPLNVTVALQPRAVRTERLAQTLRTTANASRNRNWLEVTVRIGTGGYSAEKTQSAVPQHQSQTSSSKPGGGDKAERIESEEISRAHMKKRRYEQVDFED